MALPVRHPDDDRPADRWCGSRSLRHVHAVHRRVSDGRDRGALRRGCDAVPVLRDDRIAPGHRACAARPGWFAGVRLRSVPGRMSLERRRADDRRPGVGRTTAVARGLAGTSLARVGRRAPGVDTAQSDVPHEGVAAASQHRGRHRGQSRYRRARRPARAARPGGGPLPCPPRRHGARRLGPNAEPTHGPRSPFPEPRYPFPVPGTRSPNPGTRSRFPGTRSPNPGTRSPDPGTR